MADFPSKADKEPLIPQTSPTGPSFHYYQAPAPSYSPPPYSSVQPTNYTTEPTSYSTQPTSYSTQPTSFSTAPTGSQTHGFGRVHCTTCQRQVGYSHSDVGVRCHHCSTMLVVNYESYMCLRRRFKRMVLLGVAMILISVLVTVVSLYTALRGNFGGRYFVWFGPAIAGVFVIIRGLVGLSRYPYVAV